MRFYVDSNNYATFTQSQWPAGGQWVFDHPFFIILNVAVGGKLARQSGRHDAISAANAGRLRAGVFKASSIDLSGAGIDSIAAWLRSLHSQG